MKTLIRLTVALLSEPAFELTPETPLLTKILSDEQGGLAMGIVVLEHR